MDNHKKYNIITLSEHAAFEKRQHLPGTKNNHDTGNKAMDFIETVFRFLENKRTAVVSFIRMKLAPPKRQLFDQDMDACRTVREEARCVKKYIGHLKLNDARSLLLSLPDMLAGKIEALAFHGENAPENRLMKFAKTFDLSDEDVLFCMFFFLMTSENKDQSMGLDMGRAI